MAKIVNRKLKYMAKHRTRYAGEQPSSRVDDIYARSVDAEYVLEPEEARLVWTEERQPLRWFNVDGGRSIESYAETLDRQDNERIAGIMKWAESEGGLSKAIHKNPVLAFADGEVIDGTHRLVAALQSGLRTVTVLVAHRRRRR